MRQRLQRRQRPLRAMRAREEQGAVALEAAVIAPAALIATFALTQVALVAHAGQLAAAAAREGARAAAVENSTTAAGITAAHSFVADSGDRLSNPRITGSRTAESATITVSGQALSLVPFIDPQVTKSATLPVERVTDPALNGGA